jgi:PAS domain S-box-containing protein
LVSPLPMHENLEPPLFGTFGAGPASPFDTFETSEKVFASAFEDAAIGMAVLAADSSHRLRVNKSMCQMLGYTEAELMAGETWLLTHPQDVEEDYRQRRRCLAGEMHSYQREKRYLHRDGHIVWGHLTCTLVRDEDGRPLHFISQVQDITERKLAEEALKRSEERFRSLTMLSSDWYWEQDSDFRFTNFNGARQAGPWQVDQRTAIGKRRWEIEGSRPLHTTWEAHRAALEAHKPFRDLEYLRVGDGPTRYLSCSGEPVFDAVGAFVGYRGTARDITPAKVAEQRLCNVQGQLQIAGQLGRLGAWDYDVAQRGLIWSEEVCAIHDVRQGFLPTVAEALAFYAPEYRQMVERIFSACLRDGSPFDAEAQVITAKGRRIWLRVIGEAQWDEHGKVVRVHGACQDISESKSAAEQARLVAEQLTMTLESLTDAFFTVDRDWRITYVNGEAERLMRLERAQLLGRRVMDAYPELEELGILPYLQRAMDEGVPVQFEAYYPPFEIWAQVKAFPSKQGLAIDVKDITDRVNAHQEVLRLNAELEQRVKERTAQLEAANKDLEAFSYSIAHDLRAPLSSIDGFSQMLEHAAGGQLGERCRHYLQRIRAGVRQMGELTDGLLSLASLSRASLRCEQVDLAVLARSAVAALRERAPSRAVDIEIAAALPVSGDARLLSQVIGNLVGNAWKFTSRIERARIEVASIPADDGETVYFVRDNGAGFDMAYAARMFEAFQRMHSPAEFEGTGVGLAIVHGVVTRHGGRIWAESAPQRGATFYFTLGRSGA